MQRRKLLLYSCLSGDGRSHPCAGWPGHMLSLEWTWQGWISETWPCSFLPWSTVPMKTKDSKQTQKPKPKSEHIRLHYSNCGKKHLSKPCPGCLEKHSAKQLWTLSSTLFIFFKFCHLSSRNVQCSILHNGMFIKWWDSTDELSDCQHNLYSLWLCI